MNTLTRKTSNIERLRQSDKSIVDEICNLIGWTTDYYFEFQFEKYLQFVERMFAGYPAELLNQVKYSETFSGFWNSEAALRNQTDFMPFAAYHADDRALLLEEFIYVHNPIMLMHDDLFMLKYYEVLQDIRREEKCKK